MKIGVKYFIEFAYGDKRRDKSNTLRIIEELGSKYDPAKDRYKKFREAMTSFEEKKISNKDFLDVPSRMITLILADWRFLWHARC